MLTEALEADDFGAPSFRTLTRQADRGTALKQLSRYFQRFGSAKAT